MTIILFGGGANFGLPEVSPYVTKTEVQLMMAGIPYAKQAAGPQQSPKGQIPFINDDGDLIADSTFIRAHIEAKFGVDLDEGLSPVERAQAWAVERMLENQFCWTVTYFRWLVQENFDKGPAHFFDQAPAEMRDRLRADVQERVRGNMHAVGVARHKPEEIVALGERSLLALSEILGDKAFLFGDKPAGVDATAFGVLAALLTPYFCSPLRDRAFNYPNLIAYTQRMMRRFYPDHAWGISAAHLEQVA